MIAQQQSSSHTHDDLGPFTILVIAAVVVGGIVSFCSVDFSSDVNVISLD